MESLIFTETPKVILGGNTFINTPTILQFENTPLVEITRLAQLEFTTRFAVFGPDGADFGRVVGTRFFPTDDGRKAGVELDQPKDIIVGKLNGKVIFEIRHNGPAALRADAELYTPTGF